MVNDKPSELEVGARFLAIARQRDQALTEIIMLHGRIAVLEDQLKPNEKPLKMVHSVKVEDK